MAKVIQSPERDSLISDCQKLVKAMEDRFGAVGYSGLPWSTYGSEMLRHVRDNMRRDLGPYFSDKALGKLPSRSGLSSTRRVSHG